MSNSKYHYLSHMKRNIPKKTLLAFILAVTTRSLNFSATAAEDDFSATPRSTASDSKKNGNQPKSQQSPSDSIQLKDTFIEFAGHTIGDEHRSETSSKQFFNNIDQDRDGKLGKGELSQFLMNHIGGLTLDTDIEARTEAEAILSKLDHNKDSSLDSKDVFRYWKSLESLLTVDEVAEWVVHSVQLPSEIGEIFRKNHVTGYDFPELVDNGGKALKEELNIEKSTFRKKIVRLVNARMLGIGSRPETPSGVQINLEGCSTAILKWKKSKADGFPVHKFRIQRRRLSSDHDDQPFGNHSSKTSQKKCIRNNGDEQSFQEDSNGNSLSTDIAQDVMDVLDQHDDGDKLTCTANYERNMLEWQDVYDKSTPEFHDFSLRRGHGGYQYRIQAWNAVGKSDWVLVQFKEWTRRKCHRQKSERQTQTTYPSATSIFSWFPFLFNFFYTFANVIMILFGLFVTALKVQRIYFPSSAMNIELTLASILRNIDEFTVRMTGRRVIPQPLRDMMMSKNLSVDKAYDKRANLDKCFGYQELTTMLTGGDEDKKEKAVKSKVKQSKKNMVSDPLSRNKSPAPLANIRTKPESTSENITSINNLGSADETNQNGDQTLVDMGDNTLNCHQCDSDETDDNSTQDENNLIARSLRPANCFTESVDDVCNVCSKRYKFGKRKKHNCCICFSTFCHKHGRTTHSNFIACKVPGSCICNKCLEKQ